MIAERRLNPALQRDVQEIEAIRKVASAEDGPVLMLNLNAYQQDCGFPDSGDYADYIAQLEKGLSTIGARVLLRERICGQVVGEKQIWEEMLAIWYPSHSAFLSMLNISSVPKWSELREKCVRAANIFRCSTAPLMNLRSS